MVTGVRFLFDEDDLAMSAKMICSGGTYESAADNGHIVAALHGGFRRSVTTTLERDTPSDCHRSKRSDRINKTIFIISGTPYEAARCYFEG
jgi:hypothetical protein